MTTKLPRLNIALNRDTRTALASFAAQRDQSISSAAADLIESAIEMQEDFYFSKLATKLDKKGAKRVSHAEVWK